eukprot:m.85141 g.85141  ORF g.85141 m.85141 type:complete len:1088 (+) comp13501_c0_seq3:327-3590(+)
MQCFEFVRAGFGSNVGVPPVILGLLQVLCLFYLAIRQWRLVRQAKNVTEDYGFQRSQYLSPSYTIILWGFGFSMLALGVIHAIVQLPPIPLSEVSTWRAVVLGLSFGFYHLVADGTAIFLSQPGIGYHTFHDASRIAVLWSIFAFGAETTAYLTPSLKSIHGDLTTGFSILIGFHVITFTAYAVLAFCPQQWWNRRVAVVWYARFWVVAWACDIIGEVLIYMKYDAGYCMYLASNWGFFGLVKPLVLYYTLRTDTAYWQGLTLGSDENSPLLGAGIDISVRTATHIGNYMGVLAKRCNLINFECLEIKSQSLADLLGGGGAAKVYRGMYLGNPVAVKVYHPAMLDRNKIDDFCKETALLSALRHPNIVHIEGVCVSPPCLSMVMELCKGSLFEMLRIREIEWTWSLVLNLAIDCANAVACLHSFNVIHKDIKSHNFLIGDFRVPLWTAADVQIWLATEQLHEFHTAFSARKVRGMTGNAIAPGLLDMHIVSSSSDHSMLECENIRSILGPLIHSPNYQNLLRKIRQLQKTMSRSRSRSWVVKLSDLETSKSENQDLLELFHKEAWDYQWQPQDVALTPRWSPPEILRDTRNAVPTLKSDVYSLGITLWEILTHDVPFSNDPVVAAGQLTPSVEDRIIAGERPPISPNCDPEYERLLRDMWHENPDLRPTMREVQTRLVDLERRLAANSTYEHGTYMHTPRSANVNVSGGQFERARTDNLNNPDIPGPRMEMQPANMNPLSTPAPSSRSSPNTTRRSTETRTDSARLSERRPSLAGRRAGRAASQPLSPTYGAAAAAAAAGRSGPVPYSPVTPASAGSAATPYSSTGPQLLSFPRSTVSSPDTSSSRRAAGRATSTPTLESPMSPMRPYSVFSPEPPSPASSAATAPTPASAHLFAPRTSLPPIVGSPSRSLVELNSSQGLTQSLDGRGSRGHPRSSWPQAPLTAAGDAQPPPSPFFPSTPSALFQPSPATEPAAAAATVLHARPAVGPVAGAGAAWGGGAAGLTAAETEQLDLSMIHFASTSPSPLLPGPQTSARAGSEPAALAGMAARAGSGAHAGRAGSLPVVASGALPPPLMRALDGLDAEDIV